MKKKLTTLLAATAFVFTLGTAWTTTSFGAQATPSTWLCPVSGCSQAGDHVHGGKTYAAHASGDCQVPGCSKTGDHAHAGNSHGHGSTSHGRGGSGRHH